MNLFSEYKGLRREMYIIFIGRIMTGMGGMIFPMLTLILNKKLGLNASTIALAMTAFSIISMPVNLIGGKLADKINKKNIIIVCDTISIATYVYCFFHEINLQTILVYAAGSLLQMVEYPAYDALVADITSTKDRERAYSLEYLGGNIGLVLSPTIGGLLFENHLNLAFLINGTSIAFSTILIALFLKDIHKEMGEDGEVSGYEAELNDGTGAMAFIMTSRVVILFFIGRGLAEGIYSMYNYLMPLTLGEVHGANGSVLFGSMTSVNCIIVVLFTALITKIFRKTMDCRKMFIGESLMLLGYLIFIMAVKNIWICYISMVIFTFGEIFMTLAVSPFLTRRIPASHRGRIMSILGVYCGLCGSAIEILVGYISDLKGHMTSWIFVLLLGLFYLLILSVMGRFDKKDYCELYCMKID